MNKYLTKIEDRFLNREMSWIAFNMRVYQESCNLENPILERLKFLAISQGNLDEFLMVRVAGIKDQICNGINKRSDDGATPAQQLKEIYKALNELGIKQQKCWDDLKLELKTHQITILDKLALSEADLKLLEEYFIQNIFPILSPIAVDPSHLFPFLSNLSLAWLIELEKITGNPDLVIISIPENLPRFVKISKGENKFITMEDLLSLFSYKFFLHTPQKLQELNLEIIKNTGHRNILKSGLIRVIRDSELEIEDEADDLVSHLESAVKQRRKGKIIHIQADDNLDDILLNKVIECLKQPEMNIEIQRIFPGMSNIMELYKIDNADLKFSHYTERFPERINDFSGDCFAAIAAKDIVVHHPYETFDVVINFLQQAARDPNVIAIKQTLYRTSSDSAIVKALIEAAGNGKAVTVVVELKARFDEEANIRWARDLESVGAQVVFGFMDLKTHAKISLVARKEGDNLVTYAHFGTGNYNSVTARTYSDLSFFTCNKDLCNDASLVFHYLTGYSLPENFSKLVVAPIFLRNTVLQLIKQETENAKSGKPAGIWAKMNALIDPEVIDALYEASKAGVKIELIVRGVCALRPGILELSENIYVKSIVGRFLEHARIYCFGNGNKLPSKDAKLYISSADWMPRNFNSRVEIMVPIENPTVHEQIMGQILIANLKDAKQSWYLLPSGEYVRIKSDKNGFSAHEYFIANPSLSGRGKSLSEEELKKQREKIYKYIN